MASYANYIYTTKCNVSKMTNNANLYAMHVNEKKKSKKVKIK